MVSSPFTWYICKVARYLLPIISLCISLGCSKPACYVSIRTESPDSIWTDTELLGLSTCRYMEKRGEGGGKDSWIHVKIFNFALFIICEILYRFEYLQVYMLSQYTFVIYVNCSGATILPGIFVESCHVCDANYDSNASEVLTILLF